MLLGTKSFPDLPVSGPALTFSRVFWVGWVFEGSILNLGRSALTTDWLALGWAKLAGFESLGLEGGTLGSEAD